MTRSRRSQARHSRPRRGNTAVLVMLMFPVLIGVVGGFLDLSILAVHKRAAQSAADLAALAGANDLPDSPAIARGAVMRFASSNGYRNAVNGATVTATTPFDGDDRKMLVVVTDSVPTAFMRLFGFRGTHVTARAVASRIGRPYGMFSTGGSCSGGGITWNGSGGEIGGAVHTNGKLIVNGSGQLFSGPVTYSCSSAVTGSGIHFVTPPTQVAPRTSPITVDRSDLMPCTYNFGPGADIGSAGAWWVGGSASVANKLRPGVYCSTGSVRLSGSGITGKVTFVVNGGVQINGAGDSFTPFKNDIFIYDEAAGDISYNGAGGSWGGYIYAPHADLHFNGSGGFVIAGAIVANSIDIFGSGWTVNPAAGAPSRLVLVE